MRFKEKKAIHPMYFISFFLPLIIMIAIFAVRGIYPFGDNVYLRSDMYHQYCPFFWRLWDTIRNGGSLFYSWEIGLGSNFSALYGYYLSSPLNWFVGFFPHSFIIELMNIIILIKLALALDNLYLLYCKALQRTQYNGINFWYVLCSFRLHGSIQLESHVVRLHASVSHWCC